jgi:outer membrane lipoprotein-sorting protein
LIQFLLAVVASLPPEAQAALDRARAHYNDGAAHAAAFVQIYSPAGFSTGKRESGALWIQAPERLRFDYEAPEKKTFTYDAGEGRFYAPEDRQLTVHRLTPDERARLPVVFLTAAEELSREYAIEAKTGEAGATLLTLTPRAPRQELSWLKLTVARDGSAPELSFEDSAANRTVFRFEGWRREKARAPSDYKVTGPSGTRLVEN